MNIRAQDALKLGVPLIITEFGACSNSPECYQEISSATDQFDKYLTSWAYWQYKGFGDFTTTGSETEGMYNLDGSV